MQMCRFISLFLASLFVLSTYGQSYSQIKASDDYLWGEGQGETLKVAKDNAMLDLISKIAVHVSGEKSTIVSNQQIGKEVKSEVSFAQVMKTYSSVTLTNTSQLLLSDEPDAKYFLYIKKTELDKIFEARKNRIKEMIAIATKALNDKKIDNAIQYYYWANMLLKSLRPGEDVKVSISGNEISATDHVKSQLDDIFDSLNAEVKGKQSDSNIYEVLFTYKGTPVASIDYTYYIGNDYSCVNTARDGLGLVELMPGYKTNNLRISYEYKYFHESQFDKELNQVLEAVKGISYPKATVNVPITKKELPTEVKISGSVVEQKTQSTISSQAPLADPSSQPSLSQQDLSPLVNSMNSIVESIKSRNFESIKSMFTDEGYQVFNRLINYGKARVIGNDIKMEFSQLNGSTYCRSIPMRFSFSRNRSFTENVVFVFDEDGKVDNVSFGLSKVAHDDVFSCQNTDWSQEAKDVLQSFLENYKTAYALERIDYLESVFSDDALIISGKVIQKLVGDAESGYRNNRYVKTTKYSKTEYINRLKNIFKYNEFINIKFANNTVKKMGKGDKEVYAVQIKQDYSSANYGDTGYLFLLVDVSNPDQPIIHVRAWQDKPDQSWGIIGPEHF